MPVHIPTLKIAIANDDVGLEHNRLVCFFVAERHKPPSGRVFVCVAAQAARGLDAGRRLLAYTL